VRSADCVQNEHRHQLGGIRRFWRTRTIIDLSEPVQSILWNTDLLKSTN
jgi:hypothetical protein